MARRILTHGGDAGPDVETALGVLRDLPGVEVLGSTATSILIEVAVDTPLGPLLPGWTDSAVQSVARPRTWPRL